jgi:colanic acid/amylovoran biosynthesis glycosyltransferase
MHICLIAHIFPARSETFVLQHALGLRARGHEVSVVSRDPDGSMSAAEIAEIDKAGIRRIYTGSYPRAKLNWLHVLPDLGSVAAKPSLLSPRADGLRRRHLIFRATHKAVSRLNPDIVHIHFGTLADEFLAQDTDGSISARSVVTWHGYDFNAKSVVAAHRRYVDLVKRAPVHTVGTLFSARKIQAFGIPEDRIRKIPMGIDLDRFTAKPEASRDASVLRLLCVGRMVEVKGHTHLLEGLAQARQRGVPAHLRLVGDGPLRSELVAQVSRLGLDTHVEFLGALPPARVLDEMRRADVFTLTGIEEDSGKVENQGTVYCEAAAAGLPCIGTDAGGVPEAVIDGVSGRLCRPGDHAQIADAIQQLHADRELLARFGRHARQHAEASFSLSSMLDRFESLYAEIRAPEPGAPLSPARGAASAAS